MVAFGDVSILYDVTMSLTTCHFTLQMLEMFGFLFNITFPSADLRIPVSEKQQTNDEITSQQTVAKG